MKFQVPSSKFQGTFDIQRPRIGSETFSAWALELSWNLELGVWNFSSVALEGGLR